MRHRKALVDAELVLASCHASSEKLEQLRKEIAVGIAEADRGELLDAETVFDEVEQPGSSGRGDSFDPTKVCVDI